MLHGAALGWLGRLRSASRELDPIFEEGEDTLAAALHGASRASGYGPTERAAAMLGIAIPISGKPESERTRQLVADILSSSGLMSRLARLVAGKNLRPQGRDE